jgi:hypothetical protein
MKKVLYIIVFFIVAIPTFCVAQQQEAIQYIDEIILKKDKGVFLGKVTKVTDNQLFIKALGDHAIVLERQNIKSWRQKCLNCNPLTLVKTEDLTNVIKDEYDLKLHSDGKINLIRAYQFREKGFYSHVKGGAISGEQSSGLFLLGSGGYLWQRSLGVGGGIGLFSNDVNYQNKKFMPIFGEFRSYFKKSRTTPFADIKAGYGIHVNGGTGSFNGQKINRDRGGFYFNPSLGLRIGANQWGNLTIDFGFLLQHSQTSFILDNSNLGVVWRKYAYRRWTVSAGLLF